MSERPCALRTNQATILRPVRCRGVGLHSGGEVSLTLSPAAPNTGVRIVRTDVAPGTGIIPVDLAHVVHSRLSTGVGNSHGVSVTTVEHLMAALAGMGVDNVIIQIDGPEIPAMDGSAAPFVKLIERGEIAFQDARRRVIKLLKPVAVGDGTTLMSMTPAESFSVEFCIDFKSSAISRQAMSIEMADRAFAEEIAPARTFGFADEVDQLRQAGFARGGSLDNAIVVDGGRVLNAEGLRFDDEFVRHKILDCIGDLYLAGAPILARVVAMRSGHATNHDLLRAMFTDADAWSYWDLPGERHAEMTAAVA